MLNEIEKFEDELFDMYDEGVSPQSKFFKRTINSFINTYSILSNTITNEHLLLSLYNCYDINKNDMNILQYILDNNYMIYTTSIQLSKLLKIHRSCIYRRLIILESEDILKIQRYGDKHKLLYIHPEIIQKWKKEL